MKHDFAYFIMNAMLLWGFFLVFILMFVYVCSWDRVMLFIQRCFKIFDTMTCDGLQIMPGNCNWSNNFFRLSNEAFRYPDVACAINISKYEDKGVNSLQNNYVET